VTAIDLTVHGSVTVMDLTIHASFLPYEASFSIEVSTR
jgi:hypothetical protein